MPRIVSVSIVALAIAFGAPAFSATNATLPAAVSASLGTAQSAADIAALVLANPDLAATIMAEAWTLGVATPAQVLAAAISPSTSSTLIASLVGAAAEAAPDRAAQSAAAAYGAAGSPGADLAAVIATAAGVVSSGAGGFTSAGDSGSTFFASTDGKTPFVVVLSEDQNNPSAN